jgi:hypothetical protein
MDSSNHRIGMQHWASEGIAGEYFRLFLDIPLNLRKSLTKGLLCFKVVGYF